jgi:hypothetical protein
VKKKVPYYLRKQPNPDVPAPEIPLDEPYLNIAGPKKIKCEVCGTEFEPPTHRSIHCSQKCRSHAAYLKRRQKERIQKIQASGSQVAIVQKEHYGHEGLEIPKTRLLGDGAQAGPKHVNLHNLIAEYPAHNKGHSDGVATQVVRLDWEAHPKQVIASQAIEAGAKVILFSAGVRSGKTVWGVRELIKQPYVYDSVPNLMYLVAPTNGMMPASKRRFTAAAGDALVTEKRASDAGPAHFLLKPSKSIPHLYFTCEMHSGEHADRMRGETICAALVDECQIAKPEVMDVLRGRVMESGGVIILTGTASYPGHWTKTEVIDRAYRCGRCHVCVYDHYDLAKGPDGEPEKDATGKETRRYVPKDHDPVDCYGDPRIAVITCSSFDNTFLSRENVEQLRRDYAMKDPIIARRELYAEYTGFEGIVYSRFDRQLHTTQLTPSTVPPDAYVCAGLDFGANDPFVCTIAARIKDVWHVVSEYYDDDRSKTLRDHVEGIRRACGPLFNKIRSWWHDPSGRITAMELSRYGLRPMKSARKRTATGTRWLVYRYEVLNSLIVGRNQEDRPFLRVNTTACKGLVHDLENRKWKRYKAEGEDGVVRVIDLKGKQVDRNAGDDFAPGDDHGTDALEYLIVSEFVKGLYKPKMPGEKKADAGDVVETRYAGKAPPEIANISAETSRNLEGIVKLIRRPGRNRSGWTA